MSDVTAAAMVRAFMNPGCTAPDGPWTRVDTPVWFAIMCPHGGLVELGVAA